MITSIQRIGSEENNEGWFLLNEHLQVRFYDDEEGNLSYEMNFEDTIITEQEADELVSELLRESINLRNT